jgi:hypothetical protein
MVVGKSVGVALLSAVFFAGCIAGGSGAQAQASASTVPLPSNVTVNLSPPDPSLPPQLSRFVGKWGGSWNGNILPSNLYVESVGPDGTAKGVYVWDNSANFSTTRGAQRFTAKINGDTLTWGTQTAFKFRMLPDGRLTGDRTVGGAPSGSVIMSKMQ